MADPRQTAADQFEEQRAFLIRGALGSVATLGGNSVKSFTILTTTPNEFMAPIHDRMPVMLAPDFWATWLGETRATAGELLALCRPFPPDRMISWAVSRRVGNVKNTDAALIEPLPEAAA